MATSNDNIDYSIIDENDSYGGCEEVNCVTAVESIFKTWYDDKLIAKLQSEVNQIRNVQVDAVNYALQGGTVTWKSYGRSIPILWQEKGSGSSTSSV